jgi:hypothetical protein
LFLLLTLCIPLLAYDGVLLLHIFYKVCIPEQLRGVFHAQVLLIIIIPCLFINHSVVRVALNEKISAPVAWIGLSAPSITLYCFTLVPQSSSPWNGAVLEADDDDEDSRRIRLKIHEWMTHHYLPVQHLFMVLSLVGLVSAVHALYTRWPKFKQKPFSPAHVAFCFPTLSHTNAVQAYRGAVDAFSSYPQGGAFKTILYGYWCFLLVAGTLLNIVFTYMFVRRLPEWTKVNVADEVEEPPKPEDTFVHEMWGNTGAHHERVSQSFANPAVLQANEAGTLVRIRRGTEDYRTRGPYVRTRQVKALGFDPTMDQDELRRERAELLDWVARNAPRKRSRTMSNQLDRGDVYGTFHTAGGGGGGGGRHKRSVTGV